MWRNQLSLSMPVRSGAVMAAHGQQQSICADWHGVVADSSRRCHRCLWLRRLQTVRLLQGHPGLVVSYLEENAALDNAGVRFTFLPLPDDPTVQTVDPERIAEAADSAILILPNGLSVS